MALGPVHRVSRWGLLEMFFLDSKEFVSPKKFTGVNFTPEKTGRDFKDVRIIRLFPREKKTKIIS